MTEFAALKLNPYSYQHLTKIKTKKSKRHKKVRHETKT